MLFMYSFRFSQELFKNWNKINITKMSPFKNVQHSGFQYIHSVVWLLQASNFRTLSSSPKRDSVSIRQSLPTFSSCTISLCSVVSDSVIPWTVARQAPLPWGFSGKNTGVGCHFLLQGISPTQGPNLSLLCLLNRWILVEPPGEPCPISQWPLLYFLAAHVSSEDTS